MNRIISLFLFIFIASCLNAQYNSPIRNKVTLGKQTTADGLVWRGRLADTANLLTNKLDTSVYIVLDTGTRAMWYYRASTTPKWTRLVDSLNNMQGQLSLTTKVTGTLPVANGGTGSATLAGANILTGSGTTNYLPKFTSGRVLGNSRLMENDSNQIGFPTLGQFAFYTEPNYTFRYNGVTLPWFGLASAIENVGVQNAGLFFCSYQQIKFFTDNIFRIIIDNDGDLGVNTTEPTEKLHVVGNARITGNIGAGIDVAQARLHVKGVDVTADNFALKVDDSGGTNLLSVKNNGDVTLKNPLPVANGGTGSTSLDAADIVTKSGTQSITGLKTFNVGPSSSLKVLGTAYPSMMVESSSSTQGTEIAFKTASNSSSYWGFGKRDDGINSTPVGSLWVYNGSASTTVMWISPSNAFQFNGEATFSSNVTATTGTFSAVGAGAYANDLNITSTGVLTTASSDEKYKYNILPINYGLNTILQLKPVNFQWIKGEENDLGFIAQDVADIIPEAVDTNWNSDLLMRYESIIPILTKAIQEQNALIKALEQRLLILENK